MSDQLPPLGDELESLLGSARGQLAPEAAKAKARAALGLPPAAGAAPHSPQPPQGPGAPAAAPAAAGTSAVATLVKGTLVVALIGAGFTAGLRVGEDRARDEYEKLPPKTITVEVPVPAPAPTPTPRPVDVAPTPPTTPTTPQTTRPSVPAPGDTLEAELALLEPVRAALEKKDAPAALAAVGKYDARFARGSMRTEASLMRLEALLLANRRGEAEALGKKLSASTDSELVRARVRRLLDAP